MAKTTENMESPEKMVKIKLFKDNGKYKDDVFVGLNGRNYQIQRGVEVEVPEGVAEILELSEKMDNETAEKIEAARMAASRKKELI